MHVFAKQNPSPLSKQYPAVTYAEHDTSRPLPSIHSSHTATSQEETETAYLRQSSILKWARLVFALFTFGLSIAIVAILSHLLHTYNDSVMPGQYYLALWPADTNVRPTLAILVPATFILLSTLTYMIFACIPSPRSRALKQIYMFTTIYSLGAIATLIGVAYTFSVEHNATSHAETISSWTCNLFNGATHFANDADTLQLPVAMDDLVPSGFALMCVESQVGRWMMVGLFVVQVFGVAIGAFGLVSVKNVNRARAGDEVEKSSFS